MFRRDSSNAEPYFLPITVQVFPGAAKSPMSRSGALHLYRLLQQYGWCLAVEDYTIRWASFWPRLKPVERAILIYTVRSHCDGEFGRRLVVLSIPVDFEHFEADTRPAVLTNAVEREFKLLLEGYCATIAGNEKIREWIKSNCPGDYGMLEQAGDLDHVFGNGAWVCPDQLRSKCVESLRRYGLDEWGIQRSATSIEKALFGFYEACEGMP